MAQITGAQGADLTQKLSQYLVDNAGLIDSTAVANLLNQYLPSNEKVGLASGGVISNGIYKKFGEFDVISNKIEVVTEGLWSNGSGSLGAGIATGSTATIAGHSGSAASKYYLNVFLTGSNTGSSAPIEFAVAYGHKYGSGSIQLTTSDEALLPTKAVYSQYRILLNDNFEGEADDFFTFYNDTTENGYQSNQIYVINLARARYRQEADAGNIKLTLTVGGTTRTFIDDSGKKFSDKAGKAGSVFNIVSGSNNIGTELEATIDPVAGYSAPSSKQGYGKFYPKLGIIILNPTAIVEVVGGALTPDTSANPTVETYNHHKLFNAIKAGGDFEMRRTENISTQHFFVRATNREFNFSNNPTFTSGSDGTLREPSFETDPKTYITSVGLYNDANELMAVAKTSQPIAKSFDKEVLIKVKLDF
jgi:hypothetical protein